MLDGDIAGGRADVFPKLTPPEIAGFAVFGEG